MYDEGRIDDIANYCEGDVLNLYGLFVRYALLTGKLDKAAHEATLANLSEFLAANEAERPHCGLFRSFLPGAVPAGDRLPIFPEVLSLH